MQGCRSREDRSVQAEKRLWEGAAGLGAGGGGALAWRFAFGERFRVIKQTHRRIPARPTRFWDLNAATPGDDSQYKYEAGSRAIRGLPRLNFGTLAEPGAEWQELPDLSA